MKVKAGVWIDHRKALIVSMTAAGERTVLIVSHVEKHLQRSGDSPLRGRYEAQQVPADDCREKALTAELNIFYDAVIAVLRSAESYIILGRVRPRASGASVTRAIKSAMAAVAHPGAAAYVQYRTERVSARR